MVAVVVKTAKANRSRATDIFISYAREDEMMAGTIVQALEAKGWAVFWDRSIPPGESWLDHIGAKLQESRCVLVIWSRNSVESHWVKEEAHEAIRRECSLFPVLLDEDTDPPFGFGSIEAVTLFDRKLTPTSPAMVKLTDAISAVIGSADVETKPRERRPSEWPSRASSRKLLLYGLVPLVAVAAIAGGWQGYRHMKIGSLLISVERELEEDHFGKAYEYLRQAQEIDSDSPRLKRAIDETLARSIKLADDAISKENFRRAQSYLEVTEEHFPFEPEVSKAQERLKAARREVRYQPLQTFRDCDDCPEMVVIPPGANEIGSPADETMGFQEERPRHSVRIQNQFALGKYQVTKAQFKIFAESTGHDARNCVVYKDGGWKKFNTLNWNDPGFLQDDQHPAVCISYIDAKAYVRWLSERTGNKYDLPSEAEWEYAARASTSPTEYFRYSWGDDPADGCKYGNFHDELSDKVNEFTWKPYRCNDRYWNTAPVGSFAKNEFGLHDMLGNVWEWTRDCWKPTHERAPPDGSPRTDGDCTQRVARGGSWASGPDRSKFSARDNVKRWKRDYVHGFRVTMHIGSDESQ